VSGLRPLLVLLLALLCPLAGSAATWQVLVLGLKDDPRLERKRLELAYPGHAAGPVKPAIQVAATESQSALAASGHQLKLHFTEWDGRNLPALMRDIGKLTPDFVLLDLPAAQQMALMKDSATLGHKPVFFNISEPAEELRGTACHAQWLHTPPSQRMLSDALAQWLVSRNWREALWLTGQQAEDLKLKEVWQASFKRFGIKLKAQRNFVLSGDPRLRDQGNPRLLTAEPSHDVVLVLDSDGEFARLLPYNTAQARPVAGHAGLVPMAWHPHFERYGAPQLNRRFVRQAGRAMGAYDWSAWVAIKAIAATLEERPKATLAQHAHALRSGQVGIDGFKGAALSFRAWDGQLRQPIFLAHGDGVAAMAPVEGTMHPRDVLDTLGADQADSACKARTQP
jgi:ABC transporter substrate binding protein (PQQ-dependent alcohol dehydrogenase system)